MQFYQDVKGSKCGQVYQADIALGAPHDCGIDGCVAEPAVAAQSLNRPATVDSPLNGGVVWRRALALVVDGLLLSFMLMMLELISAPLEALSPEGSRTGSFALLPAAICWLVWLLYYPLSEGSGLQASPGKLLLDLRIITTGGRRVGVVRALARLLAGLIPLTMIFLMTPGAPNGIMAILFGCGPLLAYLPTGEKRQTLVDWVTGTVVERR